MSETLTEGIYPLADDQYIAVYDCPAACDGDPASGVSAAPREGPTAATALLCRCQFRAYTTCTNRATQEDGLCDPCRRDGGDAHPKART